MVDELNARENTGLHLNVELPNGETRTYSMGDANALGFNTTNVNNNMPQYYYYKDAYGNDAYTTDAADLPASIELDEGTGDIKITAPKIITDSDMFRRVFDEDSLREYSVAYKLNPEYKVTITDMNEETGEEEEKEVTIPEYVKKLNSSMQNYMDNLRSLHAYKNQLVSQYGDKAKNMSDEQAAMSLRSDGTSIYLPDTIFTVGSFGNKSNNIFSRLKDLRAEDDTISLEDFEKVYDRDNIGRDEMAAIIALIDGALEQSDWSAEDSYTDADGNVVKNKNSATEMAKLLAFKNYILANNPHSEWWQQMGDTIESFITNAAYGVTRTFANIANIGEAVVTAGNGQIVQNAIEGMDESMEYFNTNNALVWDAVANAQILGFLGGTALGTIGAASLGKMAATGIGKLSAGLTGKLGGEAAAALGLTEESVKAAAATATTKDIVATVNALTSEALAAENVAVGTKIMLASLSLAQKTTLATNTAIAAVSGAASKNIFTEYLFDTIHDAILYDSTTLRHVMAELAKDPNDPNKSAALQYWGEQFLDNAKWWGGVTAIRGTKRFIGKTALGKAANIVLTKYIAKSRAAVGSTVQGMQDNWAGGSVIAKLREQLTDAEAKDPYSPKTNRLKNKIQIEEQNIDVRNQLKALGNVKLDWDGVKLTDESAEEFRRLLTNVKNAENSIDARLRGVSAVEKEMTGVVIDPVTKKPGYVNPTLGAASTKAMSMYYNSAEVAAKYGLKASSTTQIGQDATDYIVGSKDLQIKSAIANAKGPNAELAARDVEVITQNLQNLSAILPEDVKAKLDELLSSKAYENYYKAQNEYGIGKGVLNADVVKSYEANPIWAENGYMPVVKQHEVNGRWIDAEGKIDRVIDQEMKHFTYGVEPGQHYEDPELTRLSRRRKMAEAVVEKEQKAIYDLRGNTATNVTVISGEETELAARLKDNEKVLQSTIENASRDVFKDPAFLSLYGVQKIKPSKGSGSGDVKVTEQDLPNIVAGMSPAEIKQKLIDYELIKNSDGKLTDTVTAENYEEWFNKQPVSVKRYLLQQYAAFGEGAEINARAISEPYKLEDIKSGKADIDVRLDLAKKVVDESDGEKLIAWRTQGEGVDNFYGSSGGTQSLDALANEHWKGGRWVNIGGAPFDTYGFGTQKLVFPVNRSDILDEFTASLYKDSANDVLALKAANPTEGQKIIKKTLLEADGGVENIPYYDKLSKLDEDTLKKISEGDPRALLDATDKKIIKYDGVGKDNREYVIFPDRNPEVLEDGLNDMAKEANGVFGSDGIIQSAKRLPERFTVEDIENGSMSTKNRRILATWAKFGENGKDGYGMPLFRYQNGIKGFNSNDASFPVEEDGAYMFKRLGNDTRLDGYDYLGYIDEGQDALILPINPKNLLYVYEGDEIKSLAKTKIEGGKLPDESELMVKQNSAILSKIKNGEVSDDVLKKIADGDRKALLDISGKKVIAEKSKPEDDTVYYMFPDRNPELYTDGMKAMSDVDPEVTLSASGIRARHKRQLQALVDSQENVDFLNKIGWDKGVNVIYKGGIYGDYGSNIHSGYERIRVSAKSISDIKQLKTTELHELTHAAWKRATAETRKAIGQDLFKKLGLDVELDDLAACSRDMNELIAHCIDSRFSFGKGWAEIAKDNNVRVHLNNLARHAGVRPTRAFGDRALSLVWSFITFIKTKLLGINDAKTFDEFYYGLIRGNFAEDLKKRLTEFEGLLSEDTSLSSTAYPYVPSLIEDIDVPDNLRKIQVEGSSESIDIPVNITKTENANGVANTAEPSVEAPQRGATKINVEDNSTGARSVFVRTNEPNNYSLLQEAIADGGDDFEEGLERAYLSGSMGFAHSGEAREAMKNINDGKEAFYQGVLIAKIKDGLRGVKNVDVNSFVDDFTDIIRMQVDAYVTSVLAQPGAKAALDALVGDTDAAESAARYLVLQELAKKENLSTAKQMLREDFTKKVYGLGLKGDTERLLFSKMSDFLEETINTEMANAASIAKTIDPSSIDAKSVFDRVKDINKKIKAAEERVGKDYIMYMDENGRKAYAQVDPAFASLYSYRYRMTRGEASAIAKANALMSKAFRYGTTSVNLASFGNQLFRDFGNAILVGGAWDTIKANADNLVNVFGQTIVDQIKMFDPEGYEEKQLKLLAENSGQTIEEAAVSRELMRGSTKAPSTTERELYKNLYKNTKKDNNVLLSGMKSKLQQFVDKYNPEDLLNGKRENYLRNRVYASALNDAMNDGYTLQQARAFAEFAMNNATTNFARKLYHMQAIADSTPYFSAAINGTKSFWRMWSLDPVGITGRIMGGLVIPTMALTGASLIDENDRKVYENIPEYDKENSLVFVVNGKAMSMPIPQELSSVVSPFRQFVEYLHGSNKNDFWELMMNDLLGLSPVDLQGFSTVDMDALISDPTIFDRVNRGVSRVFSQIAPVPVKSAYMLATGTDPYSGKNLRDVSYMYWNEETGSVEVMTYEQNSFAKWFADLYGDGMSPELAEKIISGVIGTTGSNLLGDITALIQEGPEAAIYSVGNNITEQSTKPVTVNQYNLVDSIWKRAVRQLTSEKEALLNSEEMKTINNKLSQTKDETQRKKLLAERQDMVDDFQQKVGDMVKRLESEYSGTFDRKKFAAVVALLNMNSDAGYQSGSLYSTTIASDQFWDGRDAAIRTMENLGVTGTSDMSIFGYLTTDQQGNPDVRYSSPVAIMDMSNQWNNQSDLHLANIKALVSQNNLWDRHNAVNQQINAIYNKGKLSDSDYDAIDAIYVNWNAEVMAALAPYIEKMTPEAALNNSSVLDYLDSLIEVPGDYKKDKYGRYVTNSKLGNGSANQAYIRNYIKNIFQVNDSGYAGGKNYSNR